MEIGRNGRKRGLAWVWMLCLCFLVPCGAHAEEAAQTVRVGYYLTADYQEIAQDGSLSGFSYDYFMQLQKYTHWLYEFVQAR